MFIVTEYAALKEMLCNDAEFVTVYRRIIGHKFMTLSNRTTCCICKFIRISFNTCSSCQSKDYFCKWYQGDKESKTLAVCLPQRYNCKPRKNISNYCKTCLNWPLKNRQKKIFMTNGSLMKVESIAQWLPFEHSAILSTCIKR